MPDKIMLSVSFGGASLRVGVALGQTERPGVLGRAVGSRRSLGYGIFSPNVALGGDDLSQSLGCFVVFWFVFFFFPRQTRGIFF